ncbi:5'-nucleotidase SurE [Bienertia sinuspersici]
MREDHICAAMKLEQRRLIVVLSTRIIKSDGFDSAVVAGAREALISGVPSISISLDWKKGESQETDLKDAVGISVPIINAAIRDIENGGFKVTKQSLYRSTLCWQAISSKRPAYMCNQPGLGFQLAQLGRDASAVTLLIILLMTSECFYAARHLTGQKKNVEIESVGAADYGICYQVAVTPISLSPYMDSDTQTAAADWIMSTLKQN